MGGKEKRKPHLKIFINFGVSAENVIDLKKTACRRDSGVPLIAAQIVCERLLYVSNCCYSGHAI
jgi:hypothetical protein